MISINVQKAENGFVVTLQDNSRYMRRNGGYWSKIIIAKDKKELKGIAEKAIKLCLKQAMRALGKQNAADEGF